MSTLLPVMTGSFSARVWSAWPPWSLLLVFATTRSVSLDIGQNADECGSIYFVLQAEDKNSSDTIGCAEISNFLLDPVTDLIGDGLAFPVKVLVKQSRATITLQHGARSSVPAR